MTSEDRDHQPDRLAASERGECSNDAPVGDGAPIFRPQELLALESLRDQPSNSIAFIALLLGVVGVCGSFFCVGFLFGIPAIVCGAIGAQRASTMRGNGRGMAITGIVLGALDVVWSIWYIVLVVRK